MGTTDRKEQTRKLRQEDIVNAAEKIFFSKGLNNATMDEVAAEAQYSKRTIYSYFSSKEQIYDAIISRAYQIMYHLYEEAFQRERPANGLEKLVLMGKTYLDFIRKYPKYSEAMAYYDNPEENVLSQDEYKMANYRESNKSSDLLIQCIREGIDDGSVYKELDPVSTAFVLYGNMIGIGNILLRKEKYIVHTYRKDASALVKEMYTLIIRSLKP